MLTTARIRPYYCIQDSIQEFGDSLTAQERPLWPPPMIRSLIAFTSLGIIGKEDNIESSPDLAVQAAETEIAGCIHR